MTSVSACLVTRGDVEMGEILKSITVAGIDDIVVWDNSQRVDLAVYGRYAVIPEAKHDLVYVQDDDCILPPESIQEIIWQSDSGGSAYGRLVCNMPPQFRHDFYIHHALIGFGACFQRDLPQRAFDLFGAEQLREGAAEFFYRTCDIVFTGLTTYSLVDVPYTNLWWADDSTRMWRQPHHIAERIRMLNLVKQVSGG